MPVALAVAAAVGVRASGGGKFVRILAVERSALARILPIIGIANLRMQLHARELRFFVLEALAPQEPILQRLNHSANSRAYRVSLLLLSPPS